MVVLMIGATGRNASHVLEELVRREVSVRALVRNQRKAETARQAGAAEAVIGDLRKPDTLLAAADGVDAVFHLNPAFAENEADLGIAMVEAAETAGVKKFVFSGAYHPSLSLTNHAAKRPVEEALYTSDMRFTVLQPAMFMQNLDGLFDAATRGSVGFPYSARSKMTYVDFRDVAEVAAIALTDTRLDNGTFELAAPGMVDTVTIARLFAAKLGHPVEAREFEFNDWANRQAMPGGPVRSGLVRMNADYNDHGFHGGNPMVLETILGRPPRTLKDYIREATGSRSRGAGLRRA